MLSLRGFPVYFTGVSRDDAKLWSNVRGIVIGFGGSGRIPTQSYIPTSNGGKRGTVPPGPPTPLVDPLLPPARPLEILLQYVSAQLPFPTASELLFWTNTFYHPGFYCSARDPPIDPVQLCQL